MKITFDSPTIVKMTPETEHEAKQLDALWKMVIRCDVQSKVLCPVGEYIPGIETGADFAIQDQ